MQDHDGQGPASGPSSGFWRRFAEPRHIWRAESLKDVVPVLEAAEAWADRGGWSVGFLTYEAAPALDPALTCRPGGGALPLCWWAGFDGPLPAADLGPTDPTGQNFDSLAWQPAWDAERHARAVAEVRRHIAAGDTYQVNLTFPYRAPFDGDPALLFQRLISAQASHRAGFGAYFDLGDAAVLSASPELFFELDGRRLLTRPMKGTSPRGRFPAEDALRRQELCSEKNRAENLMILDMMRNDFGRVCEAGSVRVTRLFETETYPTVFQLVSEVEGKSDASRLDILRALFPCSSITGAPKIRTMELIHDIESEPRGLYTGAVGYFAPERRARLSVAIRTAVVDRRRAQVEYGTGGGIVWDSEAPAEYEECRIKTRILHHHRPDFELLETLVWRPKSGFFLLDRHLERLAASARHFGRRLDLDAIHEALERLDQGLRRPTDPATPRHRVRLTVDSEGRYRLGAQPMPCDGRSLWRVALDDRPVDAGDVFLFHKTTRRSVYEQAAARRPDVDEVVLWNEQGQLTEGCRANLVLRFGKDFLTPELRCGLLAGTYRQALLDRGRLREAVLPKSALDDADAVFLINSVRGWIRCRLAGEDPSPQSSS